MTRGYSQLLALPTELWEESLLPLLCARDMIQLCATCRFLRSALSFRTFSVLQLKVPVFVLRSAAEVEWRDCTAMSQLESFVRRFEKLAASPLSPCIRSILISAPHIYTRVGEIFIKPISAPDPKVARQRCWSAVAVSRALPHLSNLSGLTRVDLRGLPLTDCDLLAVLSLARLEDLTLMHCAVDLEHVPQTPAAKQLRALDVSSARGQGHCYRLLLAAVLSDSLRSLVLGLLHEEDIEVLENVACFPAITYLSLFGRTVDCPPISFLARLFPNVNTLQLKLANRSWDSDPHLDHFPLVPTQLRSLSCVTVHYPQLIEMILDLRPLSYVMLMPLGERHLADMADLVSQRSSLQHKLTSLCLSGPVLSSAGLRTSLVDIMKNCRALEIYQHHVYQTSEKDRNELLDIYSFLSMPDGIKSVALSLAGKLICIEVYLGRCISWLRHMRSYDKLAYFEVLAYSGDGRCLFTWDRAVLGPLRDKRQRYILKHDHEADAAEGESGPSPQS